MKRNINKLMITTLLCIAVTGCTSKSSSAEDISASAASTAGITAAATVDRIAESTTETTSGTVSETSFTVQASIPAVTDDVFSSRDTRQTADLSEAEYITLADGKTVEITEAGVYVLKGSAKNFTVKVAADKEDKVQLVLDGVSITNDSTPAIYIVSADKCFITTTDSENSLAVTGAFTADGDTNTDAVIFAKDDITLNGTGSLSISSAQGNGISCKNDIKATGGTYTVTALKDCIEAKDSVSICGGSFTLNSAKDGIHCEDSDDDTTGSIYISGSTFAINADDDAIHATTRIQIDGGTFDIKAAEGIEGTYIQINDGTINIDASDDGINAAKKSKSIGTPTVEFNGGTTTITMGQGDTDGIDANGDIIVNDGVINITAQVSSFDYDGKAEFNGGTIIINGSEVSEIPQSMMGGFGGRGGFGGAEGQNGFDGNFDPENMPTPPDFENGERPDLGSGDFDPSQRGHRRRNMTEQQTSV